MRFTTLRKSRQPELPGVAGPARLDKRTKDLTKRLRPGDIAIIDHIDLDRVSAEALVACQVAAVVNVAPSISGRYPNLGPEVLLAAGVPVIDDVGPDVFSQVRDGDRVRVYGDTAIATYKSTYDSLHHSEHRARTILTTDTFALQSGSWKLVASHSSELAK